MSKKFLLALLLIVTTLFLDATELRRDGWNLISVCQDMNRTEIDMTGIEEIQSQDGKSIYTGEWESYSNLDRLQAGYGYWVKGTTGITPKVKPEAFAASSCADHYVKSKHI